MVFQLFLTLTSLGKSFNTTEKSALKLVKLPSLKVICWKLIKITPLKVAKVYRCLYGGGTNFHEWAKRMSERYFQHEKIKFVSPSGHVMFCLFYRCWWNSYIKHNFVFIHFWNSKIVQLKWSPIANCLSQKCCETRI